MIKAEFLNVCAAAGEQGVQPHDVPPLPQAVEEGQLLPGVQRSLRPVQERNPGKVSVVVIGFKYKCQWTIVTINRKYDMVLYLTFTSCWICSRAHHARCVGLDRSDARFICSACQRRTQERTIAGGRKEVGGSKYFYHSANLFLCRSKQSIHRKICYS